MCSKITTYVNELILTLFGPFDIKCKKLNAKNLWKWKCIFRASRMVFHNFAMNLFSATVRNIFAYG